MRALITGCGGMLGEAVASVFERAGWDVYATDIKPGWGHLDVRDPVEARRVTDSIAPDLIVHMAALTDLEYCEDNHDEAWRTNSYGTNVMVDIASDRDVPLVYIGTAGIFDGRKDSYGEQDAPHPLSQYGATKLLGESAVDELKKSFIVRAGWMMGGGALDHKFVSLIRAQLDAVGICAVTDRRGSPTYTHDFARNLAALVATVKYGTYHMTCEGNPSRYDVACEIVRLTGSTAKVVPVTSDHFPTFSAPRPPCEALRNDGLRAIGLNLMRPWQDALRDYVGSWT
jgi:dTDP-4-dehydrorhamnose reductase